MLTIPEDFAADLVNLAGEAGREWIDRLPTLVESLQARWNLETDGAPLHGYLGLVVPMKRGGEKCALKVSWRDESTLGEISALAAWKGNGAVRLLESDASIGAMLLEWLDSDRSLFDLEIDDAISVAGDLLRRLAAPAPADIPRLTDVAEGLTTSLPERWERLGRPLPRRVIDAAVDQASLLGPSSVDLLANYDLHYGNVLAGQREPWLAIDPKVVAGDPEYALAQLLWTRLEDIDRAGGLARHFAALLDRAQLDPSRARAWTLVRVVDYWLWGLSVGLTEDPKRCEAITIWLGSM